MHYQSSFLSLKLMLFGNSGMRQVSMVGLSELNSAHCESSDSESKLHVSVMSYKRVELQR